MSVHMPKVFKNGNSLAVTVPKIYAHDLHIRDGSSINWEKTNKGLLLLHETSRKKPTDIDPEVVKLIAKISKKYAGVWEDLSKI